MKKIAAILVSSTLILGLAACGAKQDSSTSTTAANDKKTIVVGATPVPAGEVLKEVKPLLEKKGYKLEIKEFTDYIIPNTSLASGDLDANMYQHTPFLENFNKEKHTDLVPVTKVYLPPLGVYSKTVKNIQDVKQGATIAVPNDPTNETRALRLLEKSGLIKLKSGDILTKLDLIENKKGIQIKELDAPQLPRVLGEVDLAVINANYALDAKLNPSKDAILLEDKNSQYVNVLATRKEDKDKPYVKALSEALTSPEIKKFIEEKYKGSVIPAF
ncbi:MetQ/NlpA family ABC transporter substrate-binding protein [Clostridium sp. DJ247]|uniref:MetQ/NlpA family ABC transporter substrate-binding protein n=1 Tax=Clostridium sp. DJ247 TaxID=2726188 RepID=UPI0016271F4B|nr:MetQ/NlpA family ABC transporter substrate-binding protein [Clostridium sp. DJ247]MBC2582372.1 MetQ/NlpA family ABC transporter substrate-binding protein [Clostridium sp. DJ247]